MLWSDWTIPTIASTWMSGTAALHLSPSTTLTKSGATTISPSSDGTASAPTSRTARTQASAIRRGSSCMRANAGPRTFCTGPAIRVKGTSMML